MKSIISIALAIILSFCRFVPAAFASEADEMRAAWIATVYNSDFPKVKNNAEAQKAEFSSLLDALKDTGINCVIVQVRPKADALYKSAINPWSDVLTGTQGADPGYDPMAYMINEAHSRGMEFHAWLNPYRITTSGADLTALAESHPARLHPEWVLTYKNALYYNPDNDEVIKHISDTAAEIARNYEVDGIHFDDYFYPSNYPLPDGEERDGAVANSRRQNVNRMVSEVYSAVKSARPTAEFGISPIGIWKNSSSDANGSATTGSEGYYSVYGDAAAWLQNGTVDYITPQIYWETGHSAADYETLVKWWSGLVSGTGAKLYIGHGLYKDVVAAEIAQQLDINKKYPEVKGSFFYSARDITSNREGCADAIKASFSLSGGAPSAPVSPEVPSDTTPPANLPSVELPIISPEQEAGVQPPVQRTVQASPTSQTVTVGGAPMLFDAYNIDGYNYFKLRDIAQAVNGTAKNFNVLWDEDKKAVNIITGQTYEPAGGELSPGTPGQKTASTSTDSIFINGSQAEMEAYKIGGNNYYKLRDIGERTGLTINWNETSSTVEIMFE